MRVPACVVSPPVPARACCATTRRRRDDPRSCRTAEPSAALASLRRVATIARVIAAPLHSLACGACAPSATRPAAHAGCSRPECGAAACTSQRARTASDPRTRRQGRITAARGGTSMAAALPPADRDPQQATQRETRTIATHETNCTVRARSTADRSGGAVRHIGRIASKQRYGRVSCRQRCISSFSAHRTECARRLITPCASSSDMHNATDSPEGSRLSSTALACNRGAQWSSWVCAR